MPPSDPEAGADTADTPDRDVTAVSASVFQRLHPINEIIPLYLHIVRGSEAVAVLDGGLPDSADLLDHLIETEGHGLPVRYLCNSHPHHDHIGNLRRLRDRHGALIVAAEDARAWIADPDRNLREFALHHPHILGPSPELLAELTPTFDGGAPVDVMVRDTVVLDLGGGVELEAIRVDGHLHAELAWFERKTRTLVLGDIVTATGWPIFHGHVSPSTMRQSLDRLAQFVRERDVAAVAMSHYAAREPSAFLDLVRQVRDDVDRIRDLVRSNLSHDGRSLEQVWRAVCTAAGKQPEFRSLAMVDAHLRELVAAGQARLVGPESYVLTPN